MVFPATKLPLISELLIGSTWTPFARLTESGLTVTRGGQDWSSRAVASRCSQSVLNPTGEYSNRLPTSPNYGLLGAGTELRHYIEWARCTFTGVTSSSWPACDTGQVWTNIGGAASDYSGSGVRGVHTLTTVNVLRTSLITLPAATTDIVVTIDVGAVATGGSLTARVIFGSNQFNYYEARLEFKTDSTVVLAMFRRIGGSGSGVPGAGSATVGSYVVGTQYRVRIRRLTDGRLRAKAWLASNPEPAAWTLTTSVPDTSLTSFGMAGCQSRAEPGNTNTNPTVVYDNFEVNDYRFWGEVTTTAPAWDLSGKRVTAQFDAAGVLERLSANNPPRLSALRRTILHNNPVSYWPLEDESGTTQLASALSEGPAITGAFRSTTGAVATAAGISTLVGSAPVVSMAQGSQIVMAVPPYSDGGSFSLHIPMYVNSETSPGWYVFITHANGVLTTLLVDPAIPRISADSYDYATGTSLWSQNVVGPSLADLTGEWMMTDLYATSAGSWAFNIRNSAGTILRSLSGTSAAAYANITQIMIRAVDGGGDLTPVGVGHVALYNYPASVTLPCAAMAGHASDTAKARMSRVCAEVEIAFDFVAAGDDTALVGPQPTETTTEILFRAAEADQGILYEPRDMLGLAYRPRSSLYNQTSVQLDYAAYRVAEPFLPTDDSRLTANDVIARRFGGSFARVVETAGPLGTDRIGVRAEDKTWNVAADGQLLDVAGWRKHLGVWDEARYPAVTVNLAAPDTAADTALIGAVAALDIGDAITVVNLPIWVPPDPVDLLTQGTTEWFGDGKEWKASFNAVPAGPYRVGVLDDAVLGHLDTAGCVLAASWNGTAGSFTVTTTSGPLWSTNAGDYPFDLVVDGQVLTVSACSGVSNPQTFTVSVASVNSVTRTHSSGAPISLANPLRLAL